MTADLSAPDTDLMVVSIHPRHVATILSGEKTVELRRTRPHVAAGQPIAIYSTSPESALVAVGAVDRVQVSTPSALRTPSLLLDARVSEREYDAYFRGTDRAVAVHLRDVAPLQNRVTLSHLRSRRRYTPPQTWHFFDAAGLRALLGDHAAHDELVAWI